MMGTLGLPSVQGRTRVHHALPGSSRLGRFPNGRFPLALSSAQVQAREHHAPAGGHAAHRVPRREGQGTHVTARSRSFLPPSLPLALGCVRTRPRPPRVCIGARMHCVALLCSALQGTVVSEPTITVRPSLAQLPSGPTCLSTTTNLESVAHSWYRWGWVVPPPPPIHRYQSAHPAANMRVPPLDPKTLYPRALHACCRRNARATSRHGTTQAAPHARGGESVRTGAGRRRRHRGAAVDARCSVRQEDVRPPRATAPPRPAVSRKIHTGTKRSIRRGASSGVVRASHWCTCGLCCTAACSPVRCSSPRTRTTQASCRRVAYARCVEYYHMVGVP